MREAIARFRELSRDAVQITAMAGFWAETAGRARDAEDFERDMAHARKYARRARRINKAVRHYDRIVGAARKAQARQFAADMRKAGAW